MKKLMTALLFSLLLAASLPALADTQTVVLGDRAPIPYFANFRSSLLPDPDAIAGITGKLEGSFVLKSMGGDKSTASRTITLQNIAVTDDFFAVFFKLSYDAPISFPNGKTQFVINQMVPPMLICQEGSSIDITYARFDEAHLISDREMLCMAVSSLDAPLPEGRELQIKLGNVSFQLDRSQFQDSTVSYSPMLTIKSNPLAQPGDKAYSLTSVIERVAFTPLGTRIVMTNQELGSGAHFNYEFADQNGLLFTPCIDLWSSNSAASPEHPRYTQNEKWFVQNNRQKALQMIPKRGTGEENIYPKYFRTAYVPLEHLPATIPLEGRGTLNIQSVDLAPDGFLVSYTVDGLKDSLSFDLADANNESLHFNFVSFDSVDFVKDLLQKGGYWSNEYKGRQVSYVTMQDLQKVKTLEISYYTGLWEFVTDQEIEIPLVP